MHNQEHSNARLEELGARSRYLKQGLVPPPPHPPPPDIVWDAITDPPPPPATAAPMKYAYSFELIFCSYDIHFLVARTFSEFALQTDPDIQQQGNTRKWHLRTVTFILNILSPSAFYDLLWRHQNWRYRRFLKSSLTQDHVNAMFDETDSKVLNYQNCRRSTSPYSVLTHWGRYKMAAISQTTLSIAFLWMKMLEFRLNFHWSLFLRIQLTIFQHWFR